ncbi:MAG: homogentisate 1,2-dioxygenase [Pyrinomonadaceae bacterium]|nr:homogentisate 1,2-dioxygenase [Pyrinomonadaceae bacterium]
MPIYHRLGEIPRKRHIAFRQPDGSLYAEELMGNKGFVGPSSLLYHLHRPTQVLSVKHYRDMQLESDGEPSFRHRHFKTKAVTPAASPTIDRMPLLFNQDVRLSTVLPKSEDDFFYRNAQGDELVYVAEGAGVLESQMGELRFRRGDYLVIPWGILHRYRFAEQGMRLLVIESHSYIRTPKRYRNEHGQLLESAPYSERDIRRPEHLPVYDDKGEFRILVKKGNSLTEMIIDHHPFDTVGWDGYYYPWALNIADFEPRVGRVHLPPPVHQTFEADSFVVCSFCPRPYDFDPEAVPAPYNHSNVMSEEVIFYASSEFMSRKGIEYASLTLHPDGLPHGPHPGRTEQSIGMTHTNELAVMLDTFHPLEVSKQALTVEDKDYYRSWIEEAATPTSDSRSSYPSLPLTD